MYVEQHVLSGGKTSYDRTIGALLITGVLYCLQIGIASLTRLYNRYHAVTYFPSFLILAIITDYAPSEGSVFSFGKWHVTGLLLLVAYIFIVLLLRQLQLCDNTVGKRIRIYWTNVLCMVAMAVFTGIAGNSNDIFHYRMKIEMCLMNRDFKTALKIGYKSVETDSSLTMLRAYALARENLLGEHLFEYPLTGGSKALIPDGVSVRSLIYPEKAICVYARQKGLVDYSLCKKLLECGLDDFVCKLDKYYNIEPQSLPKHYREALTLYTHTRSNPSIVFHDDVMDADYEDFQNLIKSCKEKSESISRIKDVYGNTYWYYYYLNSQNAK